MQYVHYNQEKNVFLSPSSLFSKIRPVSFVLAVKNSNALYILPFLLHYRVTATYIILCYTLNNFSFWHWQPYMFWNTASREGTILVVLFVLFGVIYFDVKLV